MLKPTYSIPMRIGSSFRATLRSLVQARLESRAPQGTETMSATSAIFRTALVGGLQGLGREAGEQENGLALRLTAATQKPIVHVPHILCHRRQIIDTEALSSTRAKSSGDAFSGLAFARGKGTSAVEKKKNGGAGSMVDSAPQRWPRVSAIIPTRDRADLLAICLHGLFELTDYPDLEILIADNGRLSTGDLGLVRRDGRTRCSDRR